MRLQRTFHPVGQGAFYTEVFHNRKNTFGVVVYDCGTRYDQAPLINAIQDVITNWRDIDILFISHFHYDHISQVPYLLKNLRVKLIVIPVVSREIIADAYLNNYIASRTLNSQTLSFIEDVVAGANRNSNFRLLRVNDVSDVADGRLNEVHLMHYSELLGIGKPKDDTIGSNSVLRFLNWEYVPCNYPDAKAIGLIQKLQEKYPELLDALLKQDWKEVRMNLGKISFEDIELLYEGVYGNNQNEESMVVLSKPAIDWCTQPSAYCLYTGDSPFRNVRRLDYVKWYYGDDWDKIGTIQVPHHGADVDNPPELYDVMRTCVVCYGKSNTYHHPGVKALINLTLSKGIIRLVNEDRKTKFYQVFRNVLF